MNKKNNNKERKYKEIKNSVKKKETGTKKGNGNERVERE